MRAGIAPDPFDVDGFVETLRVRRVPPRDSQLRQDSAGEGFDRGIEEPVAEAIAILPELRMVEGNWERDIRLIEATAAGADHVVALAP